MRYWKNVLLQYQEEVLDRIVLVRDARAEAILEQEIAEYESEKQEASTR